MCGLTRRGESRPRLWRALLAGLVMAAAIGGCSSMRPAPIFTAREVPAETSLPVVSRDDLLSEISLYPGVGYRPGGDSFEGVDCSGLVRAVFNPLGVALPRTAAELFESGVPIGRGDVRAGDLVFFGGRTPDHVGIAVSNREMVHASTSRGVIMEGIETYAAASRFSGARRVVTLR